MVDKDREYVLAEFLAEDGEALNLGTEKGNAVKDVDVATGVFVLFEGWEEMLNLCYG